MPYDAARDQFYWLGKGYTQIPDPDGKGFKAGATSPKLSDAIRVLRTHIKSPGKTRVQVVIVGKIYKKRAGQAIKGITGNVTWGSLEATGTSAGLTGKAVTQGGGGFSTEQKIAQLMGLNEVPEKIVGMYFRILD